MNMKTKQEMRDEMNRVFNHTLGRVDYARALKTTSAAWQRHGDGALRDISESRNKYVELARAYVAMGSNGTVEEGIAYLDSRITAHCGSSGLERDLDLTPMVQPLIHTMLSKLSNSRHPQVAANIAVNIDYFDAWPVGSEAVTADGMRVQTGETVYHVANYSDRVQVEIAVCELEHRLGDPDRYIYSVLPNGPMGQRCIGPVNHAYRYLAAAQAVADRETSRRKEHANTPEAHRVGDFISRIKSITALDTLETLAVEIKNGYPTQDRDRAYLLSLLNSRREELRYPGHVSVSLSNC
jgi:hypothetical protein